MTGILVPKVWAYVAAAPHVDATERARIVQEVEPLTFVDGTVVLATCHRVEVLVGEETGIGGRDPAVLVAAGMQRLSGVDAARHVIELALGLGSAVLGEDQILHQLRTAVTGARDRARLAPDLDPLIDASLHAGRLGRSWRPVDAGRARSTERHDRSIADRAVRMVDERLGPIRGRSILVVGTGEMGRLAASGLQASGASVYVASRTPSRADDLAAEIGGAAIALDPGTAIARMDAVVVALGGPWSLSIETADALASGSFVVDVSMPPSLPADIRDRLGVRYVDIDALAGISATDLRSGDVDPRVARYRARLGDLADRTLSGYLRTLQARRSSATDRLVDRVERQRRDGLEAYLRERPDLDPDARLHLDAVTRDLSMRLFREPLARLASDPDGRRRRALDELFGA